MLRRTVWIILFAILAASCGGSSGSAAGEVPDCTEFVDGQPVPAYSRTEADDGGPGASCMNSDTNTLVLSAVWDCDDGTSFVGRDDGYYLSSDSVWHTAADGEPGRQTAFWETCKGG